MKPSLKKALTIYALKIVLLILVFYGISKYINLSTMDYIFSITLLFMTVYHFYYYDYRKYDILSIPRRFNLYNQYEQKKFNIFKLSYETIKIKDYDYIKSYTNDRIYIKNKSLLDTEKYRIELVLIKQYLGVSDLRIVKNGQNSIYLEILTALPQSYNYNINNHFQKGEIFIGIDEHGREKFLNMFSMTHLLIGGSSGSGKSIYTFLILSSLFKNLNLLGKLYLIDFKRVSFSEFEGYNDKIKVGTNLKQLYEISEELMSINNQRLDEMIEKGIKEYTHSPIFVVFDEWAQFVDSAPSKEEKEELLMWKKTYSNFEQLGQISRSQFIRLIIITQKPDAKVISTKLRSNLQSRIMLKVKDAPTETQILGTNYSKELGITDYNEMPKGRFIFVNDSNGEVGLFQGAYIKSNEFLKEIGMEKPALNQIEELKIVENTPQKVINTPRSHEKVLVNDNPLPIEEKPSQRLKKALTQEERKEIFKKAKKV
jgi:DNA segregation ATPase FtsK/SpoIIIE-like protein